MSIEYTDIDKITINDVKQSIQDKGEYRCRVPFTNRDTEIFFSSILKAMLEITKRDHLHSNLEYALNELSANASKSNSKRIYFAEKGLNLENSTDYEEGMKNFKVDVFGDFSLFEERHKTDGVYVDVRFTIDPANFGFEVRSGFPILDKEMSRIKERLETARKFDNLTEVLSYGFDSTEGGGFGLIIILLMLRKANLDERVLIFENREGESFSSLKIPVSLLTGEQGTELAGLISEELKQMPQFPPTIQNLQRELSDPNCTFNTIADTVNNDPTLSAEILRIANSPVYRVRNEISDVASAVRLIGMLGVKSVLYNYGMLQILRKKYSVAVVDRVSRHSFIVALIGSFLVRYKKIGKIAEDVYTAGLLHDMGKIIVVSLHPELEERLEALCQEKHIPVSVLEDLSEGYNHALIGSEVAARWEFPERLVQPIKHHHLPLEADEEHKAVTFAVYLANEIYYCEYENRDFDEINQIVLSFFGLDKKDELEKFLGELRGEGLLL